MPESNLLNWSSKLDYLDCAFQALVNMHTGAVYGYEALIRNVEKAGFESIFSFFDSAFENNVLHALDLRLRQMAQKKFSQMEDYQFTKLFYNLDNRLFERESDSTAPSLDLGEDVNFPAANLCFEISQRHELANITDKAGIISEYRNKGHKIAVDDCGVGFSGLQLLYYTKPDFIKIDRFFIKDIERDPDKRLLVSSIVKMSHIMAASSLPKVWRPWVNITAVKISGAICCKAILFRNPNWTLRNCGQTTAVSIF